MNINNKYVHVIQWVFNVHMPMIVLIHVLIYTIICLHVCVEWTHRKLLNISEPAVFVRSSF